VADAPGRRRRLIVHSTELGYSKRIQTTLPDETSVWLRTARVGVTRDAHPEATSARAQQRPNPWPPLLRR
jgi:hypothetical protein